MKRLIAGLLLAIVIVGILCTTDGLPTIEQADMLTPDVLSANIL